MHALLVPLKGSIVTRLVAQVVFMIGIARFMSGLGFRRSAGARWIALAAYALEFLLLAVEVHYGTTSLNSALPVLLINGARMHECLCACSP